MSTISLIAAVDELWGLGKDNHLLCHLPADLQYFKNQTLGKPIIMGRKTYDSIGRPLPNRSNIVLSTQPIIIAGVTVLHSLEQALEFTEKEPEIMIIGGAHLFAQALPLAQRVYLTRIHHQFHADVFFPKLDDTWHCKKTIFHAQDEKNLYDISFDIYEKC